MVGLLGCFIPTQNYPIYGFYWMPIKPEYQLLSRNQYSGMNLNQRVAGAFKYLVGKTQFFKEAFLSLYHCVVGHLGCFIPPENSPICKFDWMPIRPDYRFLVRNWLVFRNEFESGVAKLIFSRKDFLPWIISILLDSFKRLYFCSRW